MQNSCKLHAIQLALTRSNLVNNLYGCALWSACLFRTFYEIKWTHAHDGSITVLFECNLMLPISWPIHTCRHGIPTERCWTHHYPIEWQWHNSNGNNNRNTSYTISLDFVTLDTNFSVIINTMNAFVKYFDIHLYVCMCIIHCAHFSGCYSVIFLPFLCVPARYFI